ncbi:MAG: hypothetical protein ACXWZF_04390 [Actinomycetota bacterium]
MEPGSTGGDRRCPDCGALVSADADWCGQCFRSMKEPEPEPLGRPEPVITAVASRGAAGISENGGGSSPVPTWPCPTCGEANAIELDACAVCGTTFAALMRQDEAPPEVDPKDALVASLLFPGLGHKKAGRGMDGLARGALFGVLAVMTLVVLLSGVDTPATLGVLSLFLAGALFVYGGAAWEAYHIAGGGEPIVSSRALLWATVGVILGSIMLLAVSVVSVARG